MKKIDGKFIPENSIFLSSQFEEFSKPYAVATVFPDFGKPNKKVPNLEKIYVKYSHSDTKRLEKIEQGDWIDLSADEDVTLKEGEFRLISLGIAIKLPKGYEAHIAPRGSTFKNWGILETNGVGVVDCVPENANILTVDGYKPISILKKEYTKIYSYNIETKLLEIDKIKNLWEVGEKDTLIIEFEDDTAIVVTETQQILTDDVC